MAGFVLLSLAPGLTAAQGFELLKPGGQKPLSPDEAFQVHTEWGDDGKLDVSIDIAPGYYLYRERLTASAADGAPPKVSSAPGVMKDDPNFGRIEVWHDHTTAEVSQITGPFTLTWQGCEEKGLCYPPQSRELVPPDGWVTASARAETPQGAAPSPETAPETSAPESMQPADQPAAAPGGATGTGLTLDTNSGLVAGLAEKGGAALVVLAFFGFGLLLAFTPCVLPMVPIVAGMLGAQGEKLTALRGLSLTGAYVVAMAAAFGALGIVAAWSGQNLQFVLQAPATIAALAALFVVLALSSFGLFELRLPEAVTSRVGAVRGPRGTLAGAALLGFTSALIVGPCVTAPLAGAFLYIAQTGDAGLGASALFALGLGQGVPLLAVGLFGSAVLPRMGGWMVGINRAFGVVFLGVAIWLLGRVVPGPVVLGLWALLLIGAGVWLGARDQIPADAPNSKRLLAALGIVALLAGILQGVGAATGARDPLNPLGPLVAREGSGAAPRPAEASFVHVETPAELKSALANASGRPAMLLVTAEWCTSCKTLEHEVLPDPAVQAALAGVTSIAVDVTKTGAPQQELLKDLGVVGPPTMIFLGADHGERSGSRLVGEVSASELAAALKEVEN